MQRIDILPQSIAKFKCTSEIISSTLKLLSNEQWSFYSDKDCNSDCFGDAVIDDCGECSGGNTDHNYN